MFSPQFAKDMAKQFVDSLPPGVKTFNKEIEDQLRQFLQAWLIKMDLVTREEFEVQVQVLAKTRAKLVQLEQKLAKLESLLNTNDAPPLNPDVP